MVGSRLICMEVRYLNYREYRQEDKTQHSHDRRSTGPCAAFVADFCLESCQSTDPYHKDTQNWTRRHWRWLLPTLFSGAQVANARRTDSSKLCAMRQFTRMRAILTALLTVALLVAAGAGAQTTAKDQTPLVLKPDAPGLARNHRLILKDGSYQLVRQYTIAGDRVRYLSLERGDWEEMPVELVDWDATRKWERDHAAPTGEEPSPAMKEAADIDKEEADERNLQKARMPEVATGLELPDEDGAFALDTFQGTPELVELTPVDLDWNAKSRHGVSSLNPLAASKASLELEGEHAKVHLHVNDPAIYLSLNVTDDKEPVLAHAVTVDTSRAKAVNDAKHGAHSDKSGFAIVRVDERRAVRIVGAIRVGPTGKVTQDENVIPTKVEVVAGKHWLRIQPEEQLSIGEYALVEILSASDINQSVWDFRVDPATGDNPGSLGPILKRADER